MKQLILRSTFIVYLLIGLEIFIMISPFAAYFYSVYSPILNQMQSARFTRWLTEFFLPHFVFLDTVPIRLIGAVQMAALFGGMFLFFYAAVPLYYCKFAGRGVATNGIYEYIRHPQYLGFSIAGFGLLLYWPRFFILLIYVTMLFVYYLLARNEEQRMISRYPDAYKAYMAKVPMFLPGGIGEKIFRFLSGRMNSKGAALAALYCITVILSTGAALLMRHYSVNAIQLEEINGVSVVSVLPESGSVPVRSLLSSGEVMERIKRERTMLAYVMPSDYFLMALVTDLERLYPPDFERPPGGSTIPRFLKIFVTYAKMQLGIYPERHSLTRIIFVSVKDADGRPLQGKEAFRLGAKRYAVFHVDMNVDKREILAIRDLKPRHKWGEVPMPVF